MHLVLSVSVCVRVFARDKLMCIACQLNSFTENLVGCLIQLKCARFCRTVHCPKSYGRNIVADLTERTVH